MATPKLKLGNDKWATKQRSLLAYNDEGNNFKSLPFNVERLSGGSYVGRNGLVQYAASEEPRIDFTNYSKGALLLEPQRTNYCLNSNNASQWSTLISNGTVTKTGNYATAPDGTQTATRLQASVTGSGYAVLFPSTTSISGNYSLSVYVKSNTGSSQSVAFYGRNTTLSTYTVTNEWQRLELSGSQTGSENSYLIVGINTSVGTPDNPIDILVWGGQIEAGDYSTSLIPSTASAATRVQDLVTDGGNEYVINNTAGTLFLDCELAARGTSSVHSRVLICRDTSTTTRIILDDFAGNWRVLLYSGNVDASPTIVASSANTRIKLAITYDNTGVKYSYNGNTAVFTSGPFVPSTTMNKIKFSNAAENGSFFNGWVNDLQYFDEVLTDAELKTLTTL